MSPLLPRPTPVLLPLLPLSKALLIRAEPLNDKPDIGPGIDRWTADLERKIPDGVIGKPYSPQSPDQWPDWLLCTAPAADGEIGPSDWRYRDYFG